MAEEIASALGREPGLDLAGAARLTGWTGERRTLALAHRLARRWALESR